MAVYKAATSYKNPKRPDLRGFGYLAILKKLREQDPDLADEIERLCEPQGLGIIVKADHYCMKLRGVKESHCSMVNSVVRGDFRHDPSLKQEFFELVRQQETALSR